jgi:HD-GYP domain-containing protein (c-di-GMP phosphodiesterase class II)
MRLRNLLCLKNAGSVGDEMIQAVPINELKPGMYINQVLAQSGTVRMRSKGIVKTQSAIDELHSLGVRIVEVDMKKSTLQITSIDKYSATEAAKPLVQTPSSSVVTPSTLHHAQDLYGDAITIQHGFINTLKRGAAKDLRPVEELSQNIIDNLFDNSVALSCLTLIKGSDKYLLEHSINCCILMGMFSQFLGYDRQTIEQASLGALLMDLGMSSLPEDIRNHAAPLDPTQWETMKSHVHKSIEMLAQCENVSSLTLTVIAQHHERQDGSGYPEGLKGDQVSAFARMAAIVDAYDAMTSNRPHKQSITPTQALKGLKSIENLDQGLVDKFIQCVGVHPVGSLVQLSSGKLAIVSQPNKDDVLSPVVTSFYSIGSADTKDRVPNDAIYKDIQRIDLRQCDDEIVSGVRPEDFKLNLSSFFQDVLLT